MKLDWSCEAYKTLVHGKTEPCTCAKRNRRGIRTWKMHRNWLESQPSYQRFGKEMEALRKTEQEKKNAARS